MVERRCILDQLLDFPGAFVDLAPEELIWRDKKWNLAKITNSEEAYKRCSSFPLTALR